VDLQSGLQKYMELQGIQASDLAKIADVPTSRISEIVTGKTKDPRLQTIMKLSKALGVLTSDLIGEKKTAEQIGADECSIVDIYSMVEAGVGAEPEWHEPVDRQAIPSKLLRVSIKPVLVRGRSMEPSIMDGAIIGVDLQDKQVVEGEVYAIMLPYVGAAVKRLYPLPDGVLIRSDNKEFPEVKIRREEIQDHFILGKVKWVLQEF